MQKSRIVILAIIFLGVAGTLGQLIISDPSGQRRIRPREFTFPTTIEIPNWQSLSSYSIDPDTLSNEAHRRLIAGKVYSYQQGDRSLTIEMIYAIDTNGKVSNFLDDYTSIPPSLALSSQRIERYSDQVGYYLLFQDSERAYLTSCINPRGKSTVTLEQFQQNRYRHDIRVERLWRWFSNSESIRDFRCIWVNLSIPLEKGWSEETFPATAFSTLENVWFFWHEWWKPRFPQP